MVASGTVTGACAIQWLGDAEFTTVAAQEPDPQWSLGVLPAGSYEVRVTALNAGGERGVERSGGLRGGVG